MNKFSKVFGTSILIAGFLATSSAAFAATQPATDDATAASATTAAAITTSGAGITGSAVTATAITASAVTTDTSAAITTTGTAITPAAITGAAVTTTPAITTAPAAVTPAPVVTATLQPSLVVERAAATNTIKKGKTAQISVPENGTTGYSWSYTVTGAKNVVAVTSAFVKATPDSDNGTAIVGQGGTRVFTINAKTAGKVKLTLNYSRSWDKKTLPIKSQEFTITVVK